MLLCTPTKELRKTMAEKQPSERLPGPPQEPSAHHMPIYTSPEEQKRVSCGTMDILAIPVCTYARQPVPAAGAGLQPQGLSKWMDGWDPAAAAKQTV